MNNKIIFLIAPPRSLSTAFLRMMAGRKDFTIFNEPSSAVFNKAHYPHSAFVYSEKAYNAYADVHEAIICAAEKKPVFIKEMSFAFEEFIATCTDLIKNPQVFFIFLVRDPHPATISYYKKLPESYIEFMLPELERLTGFSALYKVFDQLQHSAKNKPYIIDAKDLYKNPEKTIENFCQFVNIPHSKAFLHWEILSGNLVADIWHEKKKPAFTKHWHNEAMRSQGFHASKVYTLDESKKPCFDEIENPMHREKCISVYEKNRFFYEALLSMREHSGNNFQFR